jgi:N-acetylglucosamine kinase-like BadF-type ATPase
MKIIADSGSTKCDWLVVNDNWDIINHVKTMGYNPYFHDEYVISNDVSNNKFLNANRFEVDEILFFGAGCSTAHYQNIVHRGLAHIFSKAEIKVEHDLMACALASYHDEPIISCILGTGSNSCHFDGKNLIPGNPTLGYVVGDEGSGSFFGKALLNAYFYKNLPEDLNQAFNNMYKLNHEEFTQSVYASSRANVYLASFMKFFSEKREHPFIQGMVRKGFSEFIQKQICCFDDHTKVKSNFVGSIAFYFEDEIREVGEELGLNVGSFIQRPVFGLLEYYKEKGRLKVKG